MRQARLWKGRPEKRLSSFRAAALTTPALGRRIDLGVRDERRQNEQAKPTNGGDHMRYASLMQDSSREKKLPKSRLGATNIAQPA